MLLPVAFVTLKVVELTVFFTVTEMVQLPLEAVVHP